MTDESTNGGPSLEQLLESGLLPVDVLHPGGLEITRELAELCQIGLESRVLDVASGSGAAACFLVETFRCQVVGVDVSDFMVERAREKAASRQLAVEFRQADAHRLPFDDESFDAVVSECTTCILDKSRAITEMARVTRPGGRIGIHDLCWKPHAPDDVKRRLVELEGERPETLDGWQRLFEQAGLVDVAAHDKTPLLADWTADVKRQLGLAGELKVYWNILRRWGFTGLRRIMKSERAFRSEHLGYGLIVGRKP